MNAAILSGSADAVQAALKAGADVKAKDAQGNTPLITAAAQAATEAVRSLIAAKADVNAKNAAGFTALSFATTKRHADVVKALLDAKADVNSKTAAGWSPLVMVCVLGGHVDIAKALLAAGAKVNESDLLGNTPLTLLAHSGIEPEEKIQKLTEAKLLKNEQAADYSAVADLGKVLIDAGANVNAATKAKQTALMLAAEKGRTDLVKLLLDSKADPKAESINKKTALLYACYNGHADIAKMLIDKGVDVNRMYQSPGADKYNCVMIASMKGYKDIVQALIDAKADLNQKTEHIVSSAGHTELDGSFIMTTKYKIYTALALASENNHPDVAELLQAHGAKGP